ncbi:hypothetical protein NUSPORA_00953 [Nucleospora cyclopteri]
MPKQSARTQRRKDQRIKNKQANSPTNRNTQEVKDAPAGDVTRANPPQEGQCTHEPDIQNLNEITGKETSENFYYQGIRKVYNCDIKDVTYDKKPSTSIKERIAMIEKNMEARNVQATNLLTKIDERIIKLKGFSEKIEALKVARGDYLMLVGMKLLEGHSKEEAIKLAKKDYKLLYQHSDSSEDENDSASQVGGTSEADIKNNDEGDQKEIKISARDNWNSTWKNINKEVTFLFNAFDNRSELFTELKKMSTRPVVRGSSARYVEDNSEYEMSNTVSDSTPVMESKYVLMVSDMVANDLNNSDKDQWKNQWKLVSEEASTLFKNFGNGTKLFEELRKIQSIAIKKDTIDQETVLTGHQDVSNNIEESSNDINNGTINQETVLTGHQDVSSNIEESSNDINNGTINQEAVLTGHQDVSNNEEDVANIEEPSSKSQHEPKTVDLPKNDECKTNQTALEPCNISSKPTKIIEESSSQITMQPSKGFFSRIFGAVRRFFSKLCSFCCF